MKKLRPENLSDVHGLNPAVHIRADFLSTKQALLRPAQEGGNEQPPEKHLSQEPVHTWEPVRTLQPAWQLGPPVPVGWRSEPWGRHARAHTAAGYAVNNLLLLNIYTSAPALLP